MIHPGRPSQRAARILSHIMALYRVHFHRTTHDRKRGTYTCEPSLAVVSVSDYGADRAGDYVAAAFDQRPELRGQFSNYTVAELRPVWMRGRWRLIAHVFCMGNDHPACRRFYK